MAHSSVIQSASIDFEISLVQSKSIWYFRQFFQLKWNESKSNKNWMHCRDVYAFQMKFYTVHWSATEITNRQEIKRSRDSKSLHAWKHFLNEIFEWNLWFQTISLEFCFFSELWLRCVFNSSFLFGYSLYFMIECITNGVTFLSFVLTLRFISSKNASLSSCWEIVFKKFKLKYFDGKESKTRAKTGMKEGRDKKI